MLITITAPELQMAMDTNLAAFWSAYGRGHDCSMQQSQDVLWFYTGVPHPLFNGVHAATLKAADCQPVVDAMGAQIAARGAPAMWWLGPRSNPDELQNFLEKQGLEPLGEIPGMALDLDSLAAEAAVPADFTVERVENAKQQTLWARIAAIGTGFSEAAIAAMEQLEPSLSDERYKAQYRYIGYLNGTPVASSAMVMEAGVAGIYAVATLLEARNRGIGRYMTELPLHEARKLGYRIGILQASTMGYPVYQKLGFRNVCNYRVFMQSGK